MNLKNIKHYLSKSLLPIALILNLLMFLAVLPQFSLDLGDETLKYPDVNFDLIDIDSSLAKPKQGLGIFQTNTVEARLIFSERLTEKEKDEEAQNTLNKIRSRIVLAGLADINVRLLRDSNASYYLKFELPNKYSSPIDYINRLTSKGEIYFTSANLDEENSYQTLPVNLKDTDIVGDLSIKYDPTYGNYVQFQFDSDIDPILTQIFYTNSQSLVTLNVDTTQQYFIVPAVSSNTTAEAIEFQHFKVISFFGSNDSEETINHLNILKTYFAESEPLSVDVFVDAESLTKIQPRYSFEGASLAASVFLIAISAVLLLMYSTKNGIKNSLMILAAFASVILIPIFILKLLSAGLSISIAIGLIVSVVISIIIIDSYLKTSEEDLKIFRKNIFTFSLFIIFVGILLAKIFPNLGLLSDFVGLLMLFALSLIINIYTYFRIFLKK